MDADETSEPASTEVVDMLSSYTRLLNKSKDPNMGDVCKENNGMIEPLAESEKEDSLSLVKNSEELGQEVKDNEAIVKNACPTENSEETVGSILGTSRSTIENVSSEGEPMPLIPKSALDKRNDCSDIRPIAAKSDLATDNDNSRTKQTKQMALVPSSTLEKQDCTSHSRPIAARSELIVEGVKSQEVQAKQVPLVPTSAEDIGDFKTWCCSLCTFNNNAFLRVCEMCETPRYKSRRKSTNKKCSTDEFVARKQREILQTCSGVDQRKSGSKNGSKRSKRGNKGSVTVSRDNEESKCMETGDKMGLLPVANGGEQLIDSSLSVDHSSTNTSAERRSESKPEILVKPEIQVEPDKPVESEIPVKPEIEVTSVETCEMNTSDVDLFAPAPLNEVVSDEIMTSPCEDEIMTSSCEEIMTSPSATDTATENLFGTESEFDDITDDDWWMCTSCKNYNFDDAVDKCEACGIKKPSDGFEDLVSGLEDDDDCWQCEDCGEFNFGDVVIRKCTKCCQGDKKKRKSLAEQYKALRHLIVDDEGSDGNTGTPDVRTQEHFVKLEVIENLMFRLSSYTDRVYLYDGVRFMLKWPLYPCCSP